MKYLLVLLLIGSLISPVSAQAPVGVGITDGGEAVDQQPSGGIGTAVTRTTVGRTAPVEAAAGAANIAPGATDDAASAVEGAPVPGAARVGF